jgi:hypothetical protein
VLVQYSSYLSMELAEQVGCHSFLWVRCCRDASRVVELRPIYRYWRHLYRYWLVYIFIVVWIMFCTPCLTVLFKQETKNDAKLRLCLNKPATSRFNTGNTPAYSSKFNVFKIFPIWMSCWVSQNNKNAWSYVSTPQHVFVTWRLIKHGDSLPLLYSCFLILVCDESRVSVQ